MRLGVISNVFLGVLDVLRLDNWRSGILTASEFQRRCRLGTSLIATASWSDQKGHQIDCFATEIVFVPGKKHNSKQNNDHKSNIKQNIETVQSTKLGSYLKHKKQNNVSNI